mmetsp:Transcript_4603/g.18972  ORF Transcript_4603/g.18972 Transcript_4603/m.18972 type:complete len:459 (-) Transcript_4603:1615-2991(-)
MRRRGFGGHSFRHGFHRGQHRVPIGRIVEIRVALEESAEEADGERANLPRVPVCLPGRERSPRIVRVLLILAVDLVILVILVDVVVVNRGVGFVQLCLARPRGGLANIRARGEHLHRHGQQRVQVRLRVLRHHLQQVTRGAKKTGGNLTPRPDQPGNLRLPRHPKPRRRHLVPAVPARGDDERVEPRGSDRRAHPGAVHATDERLHRGDDRVNQRHNLRRVQSTDPTQRGDAVRRESAGASLQPRQQAPHDQRGERGSVFRVDDGPLILRLPRFDAQRDQLVLHRVRIGHPGEAVGVVRSQMRQAPLAEAPHRERREVRLVRTDAPLEDDPHRVARAGHRAHSLAAAEAVLDNLEPLAQAGAPRLAGAPRSVWLRRVVREEKPGERRGVTRRRGRRRCDRPKQQPEPLPPLGASLGRDSLAFHPPLKRLGRLVGRPRPRVGSGTVVVPFALLSPVSRR